MYKRKLKIEQENGDSYFLWGARQTGKTTWLTTEYPNCRYYDLLRPTEFERLLRNPELLSQELDGFGEGDIVVIDEIQKLPLLLDEVHSICAQWLKCSQVEACGHQLAWRTCFA